MPNAALIRGRHSSRAPHASGSLGIATALLYIRVSGREQEREGLSLPAQLADCQRYARDRGWIIGTTYQDVMRGTRDDRPQYQAMLAEIRQRRAEGTDVIIVVKWLHRLGRRVLESVRCREELKALGVPVHSVMDGGQVSDFVANIMASTAQYEVEQLGERVSAVWRHTTALGWRKVGGPVAWGYRLRAATPEERATGAPKKVLEIDPETAPYIQEMFRRAAAGEGWRRVGRWVADLPEAARGARTLGWSRVRQMLYSPVYVARPETGDPDILARPVGRWPALIDDDTFRQVQERLSSHRRVPHQASGRYLLTGLLRCSQCGERMHGDTITWSGPASRQRYRCGSPQRGAAGQNCTGTATAAALDGAVLHQVAPLLQTVASTDPALKAALARAWRALSRPDEGTSVLSRRRALQTRIESLRLRVVRATERYCDDLISKTEYDALAARAQADVLAAEAELAGLPTTEPGPQLPPLDQVLCEVGGWTGAISLGDVPARRAVLAELMERVVPIRTAPGRYRAEITWTPLGNALQQLASCARSDQAAA